MFKQPAAFRRLCVETSNGVLLGENAPPAAFRRLCVETVDFGILGRYLTQPPSGGCVLKHFVHLVLSVFVLPAAFRRLCVETANVIKQEADILPAAFRRLCVETLLLNRHWSKTQPAAFRRLCVETVGICSCGEFCEPSRLQAAVC